MKDVKSVTEKEIGRLIARLACNEIIVPEASALIQGQLDKHWKDARQSALTEAADLCRKEKDSITILSPERNIALGLFHQIIQLRDHHP